MSDTVEFIGGPLDGDLMAIERTRLEWVVPMLNPQSNVWTSLSEQLAEPGKPIDWRTGRYRRDGRNPAHMVWQGEA